MPRGMGSSPMSSYSWSEKIEALKTPEIVAIGGILPQGVSPEIYRKIITTARNLMARTVLDVDGIGLKVCLQAQPNIHELSDLVGRELEDLDEILEAARDIDKRGVEIVLVSMGARGILLVNEEIKNTWRFPLSTR